MMNFIKTIGAFSLTFFLSVALVGVPKSISDFLAQDVSNGRDRDLAVRSIYREDLSSEEIYSSAAYTQIINEYTEQSESLDDSGLPEEFQTAWQSHVQAWREHANFLNENKTRCKMRKVKGEEFVRTFKQQDAEITATWFKVLSVARKHGVYIPVDYYQ